MSELQIVTLNAGFHGLLFLYCFLKYRFKSLSTLLSLFYFLSSLAGLAFFMTPLYALSLTANGTVSTEAAFALWIIDSCCIMAFSSLDLSKLSELRYYNSGLFYRIEKIAVFLLSIYLIMDLPYSIKGFLQSGDLGMMRTALYSSGSSAIHYYGFLGFVFYKIQQFVYSAPFFLLCIIAIRFFLEKKFAAVDKIGIVVYALAKLNLILSNVSRATIIFSTFEAIILLYIFRDYLSQKVKRVIVLYGSIIGIGLFFVFTTISVARFGEIDSLEEDVTSLRYAGEANLNFMSLLYPDIKDPMLGFEDFALLRSIVGLDYTTTKSRDNEEVYNRDIQKKFHYNNPTYIFHGTAGVFVFNFGRIGGVLLAVLFYIWIRMLIRKSGSISAIVLLIILIITANLLKGICYMEITSYEGNYLILYIVLTYLFLKKNSYNIPIKNKHII